MDTFRNTYFLIRKFFLKKIIFCSLFCSCQTTFSQNNSNSEKKSYNYQSQIFGEVAGPGIMISINYEKKLGYQKSGMAVRGGTGFIVFPGFGNGGLTFPLGVSYILSKKQFYEFGCGITSLILIGKNNSGNELLLYSLIGYRYIFKDAPLIGSVFFSPLFVKKGSVISSNFDIKGQFIPYGGISLGIVFIKKR